MSRVERWFGLVAWGHPLHDPTRSRKSARYIATSACRPCTSRLDKHGCSSSSPRFADQPGRSRQVMLPAYFGRGPSPVCCYAPDLADKHCYQDPCSFHCHGSQLPLSRSGPDIGLRPACCRARCTGHCHGCSPLIPPRSRCWFGRCRSYNSARLPGQRCSWPELSRYRMCRVREGSFRVNVLLVVVPVTVAPEPLA